MQLESLPDSSTVKRKPKASTAKNASQVSEIMSKNKQNAEQAVIAYAEADKLAAIESAVIALAKANMHHYVNDAIVKAGMAISEAEHAACKPMSEADKAKAALAAIGIDIAELKPETAKASKLAIDKAGLVSAFGKYGKHVYAADTSNGTSLVTHEVARQLLETGKCLLPEVLKAVRQHLPAYSSTGHYNTLKRMLKAEYALNVWQAGFSITSK